MTVLRTTAQITQILDQLAASLNAAYPDAPRLIGLHTGGAWIATELAERLAWTEPAFLDISLYRDDFATSGLKRSGDTQGMPPALDGHHVLLIDDVLYTGRTVRAAINVLFDYGRPGRIDLAVLFDRGGRELPICPTFVGEVLGDLGAKRCKLLGPASLMLVDPDV